MPDTIMPPSEIRVNGVAITGPEIDREVQYHPSETLAEARAAAAHALAVRELLRQACAARGIPLDDEEAAVEALLRAEVAVPEPDDAVCRRYHARNPARFRSADLFAVRHVLLPAAPSDAAAREAAKRKALALIAELADHPGRFADLAREHSACPSAAQGGSLGQVERGQTVPEFETFMVALEPGQLCPVPVATPYGYHVLHLEHRIDGEDLPYEAVRDAIHGFLRDSAWRQAVHQYLQILAGKARIEGIDLGGAETPLVQ
ncbi:peptidyl-prolyl cis-trans isomerase [Skermanella rosea]|uniref:peptidylprolyl isomerase n=1 Tax=Skermanella rosea TaxID=1817965 RepID=UPI001933EB76|nr:peptidylprolyl isomerase [Skermanella rosea]UEM05779.1 peptidyl-prolyl cis-trans isomerase [Skermanella rosea]